jgi:hypothetical protein
VAKVFADANVLWSPQQRNLLLQLAAQDLFEIYWTDAVIDEWLRNLDPEQRDKCERGTLPLMRRHFPEAWLPAMPATPFGTTDLKDRHVAAGAVHVAPSILITWNVRDFDGAELNSHGVALQTPDRFLRRLLDGSPAAVLEFTRQAQTNLRRTAPSWEMYKAILLKIGLTDFVAGLEIYDARLTGQMK